MMANISAWTAPSTWCCWHHFSERSIRPGDNKPDNTGCTKRNTRVHLTRAQRLPFLK